MEGAVLGRYRLISLLGRGGMGEVWRAHDTDTDRIVAIKVLPAHVSADEEFQRRFRREAHAAAGLRSPHVIPIHHYGEIDGRLYVDMRLVEGRDLQELLADGPLEPGRAVRIIDQVAQALDAAHEVGLLHRDIKPSNILLDRNDFAYLIDFGIARAVDETRMTKSGNTIGTFAYIAPERLDSDAEDDARADIYSLACVLYETLSGRPPFAGTSTPQLITAHLNAAPPRPSISRPDVPPAIDGVIATGMAKDPSQRYATSMQLAAAARDALTAPLASSGGSAEQPAAADPAATVTAPVAAGGSPWGSGEATQQQSSVIPEQHVIGQHWRPGVASQPDAAAFGEKTRGRGAARGRALVLVGLVVCLIVSGGFTVTQLMRPESRPANTRSQWQPYVDTATTYVMTMFTVAPATAAAAVQRMLDSSVGPLHTMLVGNSANLTAVMQTTSTSCTIDGAGLEDLTDGKASVLVAASTKSSAPGTLDAKTEQRTRLRLYVHKQADGTLKVFDLTYPDGGQ